MGPLGSPGKDPTRPAQSQEKRDNGLLATEERWQVLNHLHTNADEVGRLGPAGKAVRCKGTKLCRGKGVREVQRTHKYK